VALLAAPAAGGGWWVGLARSGGGGGLAIDSFHTMSDPFAGAPVTAAADEGIGTVVIAPANATEAQLTVDGRTVVSGPLSDGVGTLFIDRASLSDADRNRALVETSNQAAEPVASGPVDDGPPPRDVINRWDG
jgi:hypothetical protein